MPLWPRPAAICLACRTLLPAGHTCHAPVPLSGDGREYLLQRVWGHRSFREHLRGAAKTGGAGGSLAGVLDGCSPCDALTDIGGIGDVIAVVLVFAFAIALVYLFFVGVRGLYRFVRKPRAHPRGADAAPERLGPPTGRTGTIRAAATAPSPLDGSPCVAYALELRAKTGWIRRGVMLRDAATVGFEVALDDGGTIEIPAGPLVVDTTAAPDTRAWHLDDYKDAIDPERARADDLDPFPSDRARAVMFRPGDRVEVRGALRALPGRAADAPYRGASADRFAPVGTPRIGTA